MQTSTSSRAKALLREYGPFVAAVALGLGVWEVATRCLQIPAYLLPSPSRITLKMVAMWPIIGGHALVTLQEILLGFVLGASIGFLIACGMSYSRFMERLLYPFILLSQTFPKEAIAPLLLVWLGFGILPKITVAALISFFPVAISTARGLTSVDPLVLDLMRSLSATKLQVFTKVRFPSCLPHFFAGLKMAITLSTVGAIVGEFVGSSAGLGYLMQVGNSQLATDLTFAALITLGAMALALFLIVDLCERVALRKHERVTYLAGR